MAVYLWTRALIAPMVMHATLDLANGFIAYRSATGDGLAAAPPHDGVAALCRSSARSAGQQAGQRPHE
jgi:hypothetical protein